MLSFDPLFDVLTSMPLVQGPMVAVFLKTNINPEQVVRVGCPLLNGARPLTWQNSFKMIYYIAKQINE